MTCRSCAGRDVQPAIDDRDGDDRLAATSASRNECRWPIGRFRPCRKDGSESAGRCRSLSATAGPSRRAAAAAFRPAPSRRCCRWGENPDRRSCRNRAPDRRRPSSRAVPLDRDRTERGARRGGCRGEIRRLRRACLRSNSTGITKLRKTSRPSAGTSNGFGHLDDQVGLADLPAFGELARRRADRRGLLRERRRRPIRRAARVRDRVSRRSFRKCPKSGSGFQGGMNRDCVTRTICRARLAASA